jgi:thiamine-monophosphate kinase
MASPEFDLIARHFTRPAPEAVLGVGDDCALLPVTIGQELAVSTDTLVAGAHFFPDVAPARLGHKALAVNLSDLAAMGAAPRWFTLALTLPQIDHAWLAAFSDGLFALANLANIRLVGGDTTRGPLSMTLTVIGEVPSDKALRRDGARMGDEIWVSGCLGEAALGLALLRGEAELPEAHREHVVSRLEMPTPRNELGLALRALATSAIDVSDGLAADLGHICERSGLSANIRIEDLPMTEALSALPDERARFRYILSGGDDYELCFTAPASANANIRKLSASLGLPLTRIGGMGAGAGVTVLDRDDQPLAQTLGGFDHFSGAAHG